MVNYSSDIGVCYGDCGYCPAVARKAMGACDGYHAVVLKCAEIVDKG